MGLLTNTEGRKKVITKVKQYGLKISVFSYFIGLVWMVALAHHEFSAKSYFSENQLLPGLVETYFTQVHYTNRMYNKLKQDCNKDKRLVIAEIKAQMNEIGVDVYSQNFNVPSKLTNGTNIFGIYRAPRAPGVESIVLNVPYKACKSSGALALLLGAVKYFRAQTYWAKDIIFLITDEELYGIKAWLEAYFNDFSKGILTDKLNGHGGSIQAAIVLDFEMDHLNYFNLLLEGLNGQLPNLDIVNLVFRIANIEGIPIKFKHQNQLYQSKDNFVGNLGTLLGMMMSQSSGYPNGNHGMFYKYRIEAVTLQGVVDTHKPHGRRIDFESMGRMVDGIFRSINNMLEHFHQSFFLYILPNAYSYVSIGLYMPTLGCLVLPLVIWLFQLWIDIFQLDTDDDKLQKPISVLLKGAIFGQVVLSFALACSINFVIPMVLDWQREKSLDEYQVFMVLVMLPYLAVVPCRLLVDSNEICCLVMKLLLVVNLAIIIIILSILNFSAAFFTATFYVPFIGLLVAGKSKSRLLKLIQIIVSLISSPFVMLYFLIFLSHVSLENQNVIYEMIWTSFSTFKYVLQIDLTSTDIGVWTSSIIAYVLLPLWTCLTTIALT